MTHIAATIRVIAGKPAGRSLFIASASPERSGRGRFFALRLPISVFTERKDWRIGATLRDSYLSALFLNFLPQLNCPIVVPIDVSRN
jgi:hypothetical protein